MEEEFEERRKSKEVLHEWNKPINENDNYWLYLIERKREREGGDRREIQEKENEKENQKLIKEMRKYTKIRIWKRGMHWQIYLNEHLNYVVISALSNIKKCVEKWGRK